MLTLTDIRAKRDEIEKALAKRSLEAGDTLDRILATDESRRRNQAELDALLAEANVLAKEIGLLFKEGKREEAEEKRQRSLQIKDLTQGLREKQAEFDVALRDLLYLLPNAPHQLVPAGKSDQDNEVVDTFGEPDQLSDDALPHWELAEKYRLIDFDLGAKVTGSGFPFYIGKGAKLQRGLIRFFLEEAEAAGYTEYIPPFLVNEASGIGTGQLPDK